MQGQSALMRALDRERSARKSAEDLLEVRSRELFNANNDLRQIAEKLFEQSRQIHAIVESAADGIISFNSTGMIESMNPASEKIFRLRAQSVIGNGISMLIAGLHDDSDASLDDPIADTGESSTEHERELVGRRGDGTEFPIAISTSKVSLGDRIVHTVIVRDMTRRRQLEAQLGHALKMESIGQLAAGIAHEINTPIQYVGDNIRFLRDAFQTLGNLVSSYQLLATVCPLTDKTEPLLKQLASDVDLGDVKFLWEEIPGAIQESMEGTERVSRIVKAMRDFSHPGSKKKEKVDLNHAIANTFIVARNEWRYVAELTTDFDSACASVLCLEGELNQALLNLIVNAAHAIEAKPRPKSDKGHIHISTKKRGDFAEINITDDGIGIPKDIQRRVFDPFFTTKPVGKGTGQGLAVTYAVVVERHAGTIKCESIVGEGTTFTLRIPMHDSLDR